MKACLVKKFAVLCMVAVLAGAAWAAEGGCGAKKAECPKQDQKQCDGEKKAECKKEQAAEGEGCQKACPKQGQTAAPEA